VTNRQTDRLTDRHSDNKCHISLRCAAKKEPNGSNAQLARMQSGKENVGECSGNCVRGKLFGWMSRARSKGSVRKKYPIPQAGLQISLWLVFMICDSLVNSQTDSPYLTDYTTSSARWAKNTSAVRLRSL